METLKKVKVDLAGQRFGKLTVIEQVPSTAKSAKYRSRCDCGKETIGFAFSLRAGASTSCGCIAANKSKIRATLLTPEQRFKLGDKARTHGMSKHPAFRSWADALSRCFQPGHKWYPSYGGRGITMCQDWKNSFESFWADLGDGWFQGAQLGRKDNDVGYCKSNCRWETAKQQQNNKSNNVNILTPLGDMTLAQAAETYGVSRGMLAYRLSVGWSVEDALTTKSQRS